MTAVAGMTVSEAVFVDTSEMDPHRCGDYLNYQAQQKQFWIKHGHSQNLGNKSVEVYQDVAKKTFFLVVPSSMGVVGIDFPKCPYCQMEP